MGVLRKFIILGSVFSLSIEHAYAIQISLSGDSIDRYFQILEQYVLPLMVVSTIVLFCGYLASRIFHRTVSRREDGAGERRGRTGRAGGPEDGTEVFLRGLKATPPIVDRESGREPESRREHESRREPRIQAPHRRPAPADQPVEAVAAPPRPREPRPEVPAPPAESEPEQKPKPRRVAPLKAAFRRPRQKASEAAAASASKAAEPPSQEKAAAQRGQPVAPLRPAKTPPPPRPEPETPPVVAPQPAPPEVAAREVRDVSPVSVVKALKTPSVSLAPAPTGPSAVSPAAESAKARAGEIVDSLDYIASLLQQASTLVADRLKEKRGLSLEDVRGLAITGYDEPQNVLEELRMLGGDAAEEVVSAFAKVAAFNKVVRRLEQMAETEPLDEGWNELVRSRISETIFAVGQVRKTLGVYRRTVKKPANAGHAPDRSGDSSVPVGRRQV